MSNNLWPQIESVLLQITNPSQYTGNEFNSVTKDHNSVDVRIALAFPDKYQIGMSHWGLQVLYGLVNSRTDALAERAFAPQLDMEQMMRTKGIPLFTLESHTAVKDFDIFALSLQYELVYTNVLNMLDLAGIPLERTKRDESHPLVMAGGPSVFNPEPMADFIDIFVIGDGEEVLIKIVDEFKKCKQQKLGRAETIKRLAQNVPSVYAPSLHEVTYNPDQTIKAITPFTVIPKATVANMDDAFYPLAPIVPFGDAIHNRINLEIMRGCPHSCRFCVSSVIKSPLRFRSVPKLMELAEAIYKNTGYDEISLLSLSSGDHPDIDELILRLTSRFKSKRVGLSLPSLRVDERLMTLPAVLNAVRKSGFTMAPEAGTDRLRAIISKDIKDQDLYAAVRAAYKNGWRLVKLYFMVGLPGETMDDIKAIVEVIYQASQIGREFNRQPGNVNVTISPFVPKPHTPFQWSEMNSMETLREKQAFLRDQLRSRHIKVKFHPPERSFIESIFSRGDRRLGRLLVNAFKQGCKFDAWDEHFDFSKWQKAFDETKKENGFDPGFYALRKRDISEVLPWDMIDGGLSKEHLKQDMASVTPAVGVPLS
ncbi:MAG TPA: TIGR03960 family B12-binding radical SAM protein [Planctomycetota bacterium]|nr:TIGR03960 family B12-binding radical SAM protein [Planctomycetota bacterium]